MSKSIHLEFKISSDSAPGSDTDLVALYQDSAKKPISPRSRYGALVSKIKKNSAFAARLGSVQSMLFLGEGKAPHVTFVGLGNPAELTEEKVRSAAGNAYHRLVLDKSEKICVFVDPLLEGAGMKNRLSPTRLVRCFAEGLVLGAYQWSGHKGDESKKTDKNGRPSSIVFVSSKKDLKKSLETELAEVRSLYECVNVTRDWSNEPSNYGTPEFYASEAKRLAKQYGLKCRVLSESEAKKEKMGLFLAVGQGSEREGKMVILEYAPKGAKNSKKNVVLVGKGVTFDSGGISIKPSMRMEDMKHDMTGAATIMGAILLASRWKVKNKVTAILAFTENMPSGNAIQPGNVVRARSGKTVEIINTDAEGRLILADALDYAQDFKPSVVIDAATLTGAVSIALGKQCCAVLGNDQELVDQLIHAGSGQGERIWQLPLFDEYFDDLKSDTADMKNSANDGNGGTIRGAIFLKQFIRKDVKWAHLDIAATAWNLAHLSYLPKKGASGIYVRTLAQFAREH